MSDTAAITPARTPSSTPPDAGWLVPLLVLVAGMFMSLLDTTIVNVAIPRMQTDFGVATEDIQWITTAYTLSLGVVVPLSGWLGDRIGLSRVYRSSMLVFAAASILCGMSWNLASMIVFRIVQAVPGGILPVAAMSMVYRIVPKQKIGTAMGIYGIGVGFAPALGPTLGGYLVDYLDWRVIFYINAPIGLLGAAAAFYLLPKTPPVSSDPFDWWGFATIGVGLFALLLAFSKAEDWHWTSYKIMMLLVGGALCLALFVVIELERDTPLIQLRALGNWPFVNSLLLASLLSIGLQTVLFYYPLFLQASLHYQALPTGLLMLPESLVMVVMMPIAGRLYDKIGPRWPVLVGLGISAYGTWLLAGISPDLTRPNLILWTCVRALGNGMALMPIMTAGLASIPTHHATAGPTLNNITTRVASAIGLAAMTALANHTQAQLAANNAALMPLNSTLPQIQDTVRRGLGAMLGLYNQLQLHITAGSYSDVFSIVALITLIGVGFGATLNPPRASGATGPETMPVNNQPRTTSTLGSRDDLGQRNTPGPTVFVSVRPSAAAGASPPLRTTPHRPAGGSD